MIVAINCCTVLLSGREEKILEKTISDQDCWSGQTKFCCRYMIVTAGRNIDHIPIMLDAF
jgi:DNA-directed RNA polymerase subunit N (RpoN/RPB10)